MRSISLKVKASTKRQIISSAHLSPSRTSILITKATALLPAPWSPPGLIALPPVPLPRAARVGRQPRENVRKAVKRAGGAGGPSARRLSAIRTRPAASWRRQLPLVGIVASPRAPRRAGAGTDRRTERLFRVYSIRRRGSCTRFVAVPLLLFPEETNFIVAGSSRAR